MKVQTARDGDIIFRPKDLTKKVAIDYFYNEALINTIRHGSVTLIINKKYFSCQAFIVDIKY